MSVNDIVNVRNTRSFYFKIVSLKDVLNIVQNMPNKCLFKMLLLYSKNHFGLSNFTFNQIINNFVNPLTYFVNNCLIHGIFPEKLKSTIVHPVFKKGKFK